MTNPLSQVGNADYRSNDYGTAFSPAPEVPTSFAEWRRVADEHFEKAGELAQKFLADLDCADALTVIEALHGVGDADRDEVRDQFEKFVIRKW